mmetsp:Transcript_37428/g.116593  ORF Transcript_37428/g.116593 Transcript_37428/m.116593 type:complete len:235 (+) Transcript_37428:287-991(+)
MCSTASGTMSSGFQLPSGSSFSCRTPSKRWIACGRPAEPWVSRPRHPLWRGSGWCPSLVGTTSPGTLSHRSRPPKAPNWRASPPPLINSAPITISASGESCGAAVRSSLRASTRRTSAGAPGRCLPSSCGTPSCRRGSGRGPSSPSRTSCPGWSCSPRSASCFSRTWRRWLVAAGSGAASTSSGRTSTSSATHTSHGIWSLTASGIDPGRWGPRRSTRAGWQTTPQTPTRGGCR